MKRAVLAIATAVAVAIGVAGGAFAQEGAPPPPQQELPNIEIAPAKKGKAPSQAELNAQASARVPQLLATAKTNCTPTEVRYAGSFNRTMNGKKANFDAIEVACQNAVGYMITAFEKNGPVGTSDCIVQSGSAAPGVKDPLMCQLPANEHSEKYLQPALATSGSPCKATGVRAIGKTDAALYYELSCASGTGVVLSVPNDPAGKPQAMSCFQAAAGNLACKLTTDEKAEGVFKALAAKANDKCAPTKQRYVMTTIEGDVIEVACADGSGLMVIANTGEFVKGVPCVQAMGYKDGCTLTDTRAAQTAEAAIYTREARKVGFDCDVEKYGLFTAGGGKEIVELKCKNRPEGAVAIFTGAGDNKILNCNRAAAEGFNCKYSPIEASYPAQTEDLKAKGKSTCVVNGSRPIGRNKESAYVEVTCADGDPGWVMVYPLGDNKVTDVMNCGQAQSAGIGGCALPGNKKKS